MKASETLTVDNYIASFPKEAQQILTQIRNLIRAAAPNAEEMISYKMPAYKYHGILVYFAGYKNHIGFYAAPTAHEAFKKELSVYKTGKGSVQFPIDKPLPYSLITKMVKYKLKENKAKAPVKLKLKKV